MGKVIAGIDIGGTNTEVGIVLPDGAVLRRASMPTQSHGADFAPYLAELSALISSLVASCGDVELAGIGMGAPNGNYHRGTIENPANLAWRGVIPVADMLSARFGGIPVKLTNDANAAAMGEMLFGAARGCPDFVAITLGTGVGGGVVTDGKLLYGHDGFAGEVGHMTVNPGGRMCGCGRRGCFETYLSASGLVRTAAELMADGKERSALGDIPFNKLTSKDIYTAAMQGDALARQVFDISGRTFGRMLASMVAMTSPKAFFVMGGVAKAGDLLLAPTRASLEEHLLYCFKGKVAIHPSGLPGIDAAILGAAAIALEAAALDA